MGRKEILRERAVASAKQVNVLMAAGMDFIDACRRAKTAPATYRKYKDIAVLATEVPVVAEPKTLVARLLKSNLSADDKIALLTAAYN